MKTAEQLIKENIADFDCINIEPIERVMKLYANQKLDEAAEKANIKNTFTYHDGTTEEKFCDGVKYGDYTHTINKQSILSLKDKV